MRRQLFAFLSACLLLAGCDTIKMTDLAFDGTDQEYGLVMFGIAAEPGYQGLHELVGWHVRWEQWPLPTPEQMVAERSNLTLAEAQKRIDDGASGVFANRPPSSIDTGTGNEPRMDQVRYYIRPVQERTYYMRELRIIRKQHGRPGVSTTVFARDSDTVLMNANVEDMIKKNTIPNFRAKPGQVIYIGNFHFELSRDHTQRSYFVKHSYDEEAARAYLAQYPKISAPPTPQQWRGFPPPRPVREERP